MSVSELVRQGTDAFEDALSSRKRTNYFSMKDGQSVTLRFLQEVDPASEHYNEDAGAAVLATIVSPPGPEGWKYRYVAPDHLLSKVSDWVFKTRLLVNVLVLVDADKDEWEVQFWDTSKANARQLLEFNNEDGSITDKLFKVKRSGSSTDTTYIMMPKAPDGGISVDKYVDDLTTPDDYLRELTEEEISRHVGEQDETDTEAGSWT